MVFSNDSITTNTEPWFIFCDILEILCTSLAIIFVPIFLFIILTDKTCHTIPMILVVNSCLSAFIFGIDMFLMVIFRLQNDLKKIEYEDFYCIFRGYISYVACALQNNSYFLQAISRYITVVYPNRLVCQSARFQILFICIIWIFSFLYPLEFTLSSKIIYNVNSQICQLPLELSFSIIYMILCCFIIPILLIMFIYFKLVRYVKQMSKRITPANTLFRAQNELKMVRRIVILITILIIVCFPYTVFIFMSFFNSAPKYHFRIAYVMVNISLLFVIFGLFQFNDPLKMSIMKKIKRRTNVVVVATLIR